MRINSIGIDAVNIDGLFFILWRLQNLHPNNHLHTHLLSFVPVKNLTALINIDTSFLHIHFHLHFHYNREAQSAVFHSRLEIV